MAGIPQLLTALAHMRNTSLLSPSNAARISINTGPNAFYGEKYKVEKVMTNFTGGLFLTLYATRFLIEGFRRQRQNYVWNYFCCIRFQTKETFHEWYVFLPTSKLDRDRYGLLSILGIASPQLVVCNI
jgi:hypothetical protein